MTGKEAAAVQGNPLNVAWSLHLSELDATLVESMMDEAPSVLFLVKDLALRYVHLNTAMAALCGATSRAEVQGKSARDFFPSAACDYYEGIDQLVMRTGRPIRGKLYLTPPAQGQPAWTLYSRWPVYTPSRAVAGVASIMRLLDNPEKKNVTYQRMKVVVDYIESNIAGRIEVTQLAALAGTSVSQLERDFVEVFGTPPARYVTKARFETALELLRAGGAVAEIAHACGYSDQSAFTRRFKSATGMSPLEFRRLHAGDHDPTT